MQLHKVIYNKRTNQAVIFLKKKKLNALKEKRAKFIKIRNEDFIF